MSKQPRVNDIITPESFAVAPGLLGLPLAKPWRRACAFLFDLIPVAILSKAGVVWFLAFLAATLVWRGLSYGSGRAGPGLPAFARAGMGFLALIAVLRVGGALRRDVKKLEGDDANPPSADSIARIVSSAMATAGVSGAVPGLDALPANASLHGDTTLLHFAQALLAGDTSRVRALRAGAETAMHASQPDWAATGMADLARRNEELKKENDRLKKQSASPHGIKAVISAMLDDLGIGFGWGALYFTTLLVLGHGQTPGKRFMGIRVIRLDAEPIGWWMAFERFGSYFASLSTGLLGFAQIFWDRNRQALHDKCVESVVIRVQPGAPAAAD